MQMNNKRIAIARDFAIVLKNDGSLVLLGHNPQFKQLRSKVTKVAAAFSGYMGLTSSGNVITCGNCHEFEMTDTIESLRNVRDIISCEGHTVAILEDGRTVCIDEPCDEVPRFSIASTSWINLKQVAVGFLHIVGLKQDGTIEIYDTEISNNNTHTSQCNNSIFSSRILSSLLQLQHVDSIAHHNTHNERYPPYQWSNLKQIDAFSCYYGIPYTIGLRNDGSVVGVNLSSEISTWRNIVSVSVGNNGLAVGLKSDGTVNIMCCDEDKTRIVRAWRNVQQVECKFSDIVAILDDGGK